MSSILDALNKLEEEKKEAARTAAEAAIDPRVAARELVGRASGRRTTQGHPLVWGLAGIAVFFMVTLSAAVAAYFVLKPSMQGATMAAAAPSEVSASAPAADVESEEPAAPAVEEETASALASTSSDVVAEVKPEPMQAKPAEGVANAPAPAPAEPPNRAKEPKAVDTPAALPKPFDVASNSLPELGWVGASATTTGPDAGAAASDAVTPAPETPMVDVTPLPAPAVEAPPVAAAPPVSKPGPIPADITKLPVLRESDKPRVGWDDVDINMLQPRSETRPYARAIINLKPVMIGETIPGTRATLIGVEINGMAIEVSGSRERYFVPFGFSI